MYPDSAWTLYSVPVPVSVSAAVSSSPSRARARAQRLAARVAGTQHGAVGLETRHSRRVPSGLWRLLWGLGFGLLSSSSLSLSPSRDGGVS
jgi:hypothetical protein